MMAGVTGRARMIDSVNELTGTGDCSEAILAQERPASTPWVIFLVGAVFGFLAGAFTDLGTIFVGVIVGLVVGGGFVLTTGYWVLARVGGDVVLARSSKLSATAVEIVETWPAPVQVEVKKGLMQSRMNVGGRSLMIARQFASRADTIVG